MPDDIAPQPTDDAPKAPAEPATPAPPWGSDEEFSPERAWKRIQNMQADLEKKSARLTEFEKAAKEREDAEKSELQKAIERAEKAEKSLAARETAEKRKAVLSKHKLTDDDAAWLAGVPDDELDAKAQALAARLGIKQDAAEEIPAKPTPALTPGHQSAPSAPAFDPNAIADKVRRR